MWRLELVGLDGATVFLPSEQVGSTVGALRQWEAARAGLPSPSLLRLKSGNRNLSSDDAPLAEVDASVHAMLRLPGGTHPMDAMCRAFPADPQRAVLEKKKNQAMAEKNRAEAATQVNELLKRKLEAAKFEAYPAPQTAASAADDATYRAKLEKQRRKLMDGGSDSDSSVSVFDPFMSKKAKKEMKKREKKDKKDKKERKRDKKDKKDKKEKKEKKEKKKRERESSSDESDSSDSDDEVERKHREEKHEKKKKHKKEKKKKEKRQREGGGQSDGHSSDAEDKDERKKSKGGD